MPGIGHLKQMEKPSAGVTASAEGFLLRWYYWITEWE